MSVTGAIEQPSESPQAARPARDARWPRRLFLVICAIAVLTAAGLVAWNNGVKQYLFPKKFGVVEPGRIYRSGQISARLLGPTLDRYHIAVLIDLSQEDTPDARAERKILAQKKIRVLSLPLRGDGVGDPENYVKALTAIIEADHAHQPVLVHCQAGTERTGGVVAAYRILVEGKSEDQAFAEARGYGHSDRENPLLVPFLKEHLPQWRGELVSRHLIPN
jgi:protein-tyrosine phosphatase